MLPEKLHLNIESSIDKGKLMKPKIIKDIPCPYAGMKCPCGCGMTYGGICLRKQPCSFCTKASLRMKDGWGDKSLQ